MASSGAASGWFGVGFAGAFAGECLGRAAGLLAGVFAGAFGVAFAGVWGPDWVACSGVWGCRCGAASRAAPGACPGGAPGPLRATVRVRGAGCGSRGGCACLGPRGGVVVWGCGGDGFLFVARVGAVFGVCRRWAGCLGRGAVRLLAGGRGAGWLVACCVRAWGARWGSGRWVSAVTGEGTGFCSGVCEAACPWLGAGVALGVSGSPVWGCPDRVSGVFLPSSAHGSPCTRR